MTYTCPVCGYPKLIRPPTDYMICPSCGTEFGYDDFDTTHTQLRYEWLGKGAPWFSRHTPPPPHWNAFRQVLRVALLHHVNGDVVQPPDRDTVRVHGRNADWATTVPTQMASNITMHTARMAA
jgi:hypothetical protein